MKLTKIEDAFGKTKIGSFVMHHPAVGFALGSQAAAMILEVLICWDGSQHDPEGWIYKSHVGLTAETGLTPRQQRPAIKLLVVLGLVKKKVSGLPPTNGFLLQNDKIQEWWFDHCKKNNLSQLISPEGDKQSEPEVPILLYTSTHHDATGISTPAVMESPVPKTNGFEPAGTFQMRKARDEYLARSQTRNKPQPQTELDETAKDKGDPETEQVISELQTRMKLPMLDRTLVENRRMAKLALEKFGMEQITTILMIAAEDEFWRSRVTSVSDICNNGMKILSCKRYPRSKGATIV